MKKTVVITGASAGIGREMARQMAQEGYVVYDLSRSDKPLEGVKHIACDVTKREMVDAAISKICSEAGRIDLLVLCAGSGVAGALEFMTEEEMQFQFDVNTFGPLRVVQAALPQMRSQEKQSNGERGRIVFISSMGATFPLPYQGLYSGTKAAISALAYSLASEIHPFDISVTCILPGDVKTNFTAARRKNTTGSDIYTHMDGAYKAMEGDEVNGSAADKIAANIIKKITRKHVKLYYTPDLLSKLQYIVKHFVPTSLTQFVVRKMYNC